MPTPARRSSSTAMSSSTPRNSYCFLRKNGNQSCLLRKQSNELRVLASPHVACSAESGFSTIAERLIKDISDLQDSLVSVQASMDNVTMNAHLCPCCEKTIDDIPEKMNSLYSCFKQEFQHLKNEINLAFMNSNKNIRASQECVMTSLDRRESSADNILTLLESHSSSLNELLLQSPGRIFHDSQDTGGEGTSPSVNEVEKSRPEIDTADHELCTDVLVSSSCDPHAQMRTDRENLLREHGTPKLWAEFQDAIEDFDPQSDYHKMMDQRKDDTSLPGRILQLLGWGAVLDRPPPNNLLAKFVISGNFGLLQTMLILANTLFMGIETNAEVQAALEEPPGTVPKWFDFFNFAFTIVFTVELALRMIVLRWWFWMDPKEWLWNLLDVCLVTTALMSDLFSSIDLSFVRMLRILRVVRVARIVRVVRVFRELRKMMFSIIACLRSLAWAFVFLAMVVYMFSILFLQGVTHYAQDLDRTRSDFEEMRSLLKSNFGSLSIAMMSCLSAVTGGDDWESIRRPLRYTGMLYSTAFVFYICFVTMGVMNVLTGVFLSSASDFTDVDMIVQDQQVKVDNLTQQLMELFRQLDLDSTGEIDWIEFSKAMSMPQVRGFLASMDLEPTHIRLIFDLLDEQRSGKITVSEFVKGMITLRGQAKSVDARIIQREIGMLPLLLQPSLKSFIQRGLEESRR